MIPIYEQRNGRGVGYNYHEFSARFDEICREHLRERRATAFAFIFYDFGSALHQTLKDRDVFTELDRLAGKTISIFYLDTPTARAFTARFTRDFAQALGLADPLTLPCIVFFKVTDGKAKDVIVATLPDHEAIGYQKLYSFIDDYVSDAPAIAEGTESQACGRFHWIKAATKFVSTEFVKDTIQAIVEHVPL